MGKDGEFEKIKFEGNPGLKQIPKGCDPYDFFELLFDVFFFSMTVNKYGEKIILKDKWKKLTVSEF